MQLPRRLDVLLKLQLLSTNTIVTFRLILQCSPHTYVPGLIQIRSGLGSYNRKTLPQPPKVIII